MLDEKNLRETIRREQASLLIDLKRSGTFEFVQEDTEYLREISDRVTVQLRGVRLLYYYDKALKRDVAILWHKIVVCSDLTTYRETSDILKEVLKGLKLKHFHDEDASGGGLVVGQRSGTCCAHCYINPDYPLGYWENHTLGRG